MKHQFGILYKKLEVFIIPLSEGLFRKILKPIKLYKPLKWFLLKLKHLTMYIPNKQLNFFSQFLKENDLCFDIGAWEGEYTEIFLKLGARVVAVEPQEDCVKKLYFLFGKNKNVKIVGKALGDRIGRDKIAICETQGQSQKATLSPRFRTETRHANMCEWNKIQDVLVTTLDSLIFQYGIPKFCKIDVEGYEEFVMQGLSQPIHFISFEFHKELLDMVEKCCNYLSMIGDVEFNCTVNPIQTKFLFSKWINAEKLYKELNSRNDPLLGGDIYARFV